MSDKKMMGDRTQKLADLISNTSIGRLTNAGPEECESIAGEIMEFMNQETVTVVNNLAINPLPFIDAEAIKELQDNAFAMVKGRKPVSPPFNDERVLGGQMKKGTNYLVGECGAPELARTDKQKLEALLDSFGVEHKEKITSSFIYVQEIGPDQNVWFQFNKDDGSFYGVGSDE